MALITRRLSAFRVFAFLKHRRWWLWNVTWPAGDTMDRLTSADDTRITSEGDTRTVNRIGY